MTLQTKQMVMTIYMTDIEKPFGCKHRNLAIYLKDFLKYKIVEGALSGYLVDL